MRVLRYRADAWPVAFTCMVLAVQLAIFSAVGSLWIAALLVLAFQPIQAVAIACNHYQHHKNVFTWRPLNRLYEVVLFLQTGMPPYLITLHHNLGHHAHYLDPEQDTLRWKRPDGSVRSLAECLVHNFAGHFTWTMRIGRRFPKIYRKLKVWLVVSCLPLAVFLWLDPLRTSIVFLLPMAGALFNVARLGYEQHAGLDLDDHLTASRNVESRLYNLVTFNSGFHTAHHLKPGRHWSELPQLHREIRDEIPEDLRQGFRVDSPDAAPGTASNPASGRKTS